MVDVSNRRVYDNPYTSIFENVREAEIQFDLDERAELFFSFAGQSLHLVYANKEHKEYGAYRPGTIRIDGELWDYSGGEKETRSVCIDRERLKQLDFDVTHEILVELV